MGIDFINFDTGVPALDREQFSMVADGNLFLELFALARIDLVTVRIVYVEAFLTSSR